ncbi:hypothetical protein Lsan_1897 [Legionella santicrucis]|uniref:Uncharacterized protein n=1 Tax=Legionella santicrucis TaxID=45074 RepID=A0A0W0YVV0_9GAMM|nr:hypothetical protein [Legionella santicrucis]KTD60999.1 hypothetical protein Lsan_1897 [Legionella santicrucis]
MLNTKFISKFSIFSDQLISETGNSWIDEVIFVWALKTLRPEIKQSEAASCFTRMKSCYDDEARFFHRGLGHPRQLIPKSAEQAYCKLISRVEPFLKNQDEFERLTNQFDSLIPKDEKLAVAQGILGAFYHDVIHRKGRYHEALLPYAAPEAGTYRIDPIAAPLSAALIKNISTKVVEEVSCLVAEIELLKLGIDKKLILPILMATYCTIPFSNYSDKEEFDKIMTRIINAHSLALTDQEKETIYNVAVGVANRDKWSYGSDTLNEFNIKTWGMMFERNPLILTNQYILNDLANTFHEFYSFHKILLQQILEGKKQIFYGSDTEIDSINILNRNALRTLELDIELNGLLLATIIVTMQLLKEKNIAQTNMLDDISSVSCLKNFIDQRTDHNSNSLDSIPNEIVTVLQQQNKEVSVNGHRFIRGSSLTALTLDLVKCFGTEALLQLADNYPNTDQKSIDLNKDASASSIHLKC